MEELLHEAQLAFASDERALEAGGTEGAFRPGHHAHRAPELDGLGLALELVPAGVLIGDCGLRCALRRVAHQHGARLRDALDSRGGVHEVARDHALALGPECHRGLARQHSCSGTQARIERRHRRGQLERGPHGSLGVVFFRERSAPDGHDRVSDELLHGSAVARDRRPGNVEVACEELPSVLSGARLRRRGEADEIDEQNRHDSALGDRGRCAWLLLNLAREVAQGRTAFAAEPGRGSILSGAGRTRPNERGSTIAAELRPCRVVGAAARTGHSVRP
jgi:hypothetical protein